MLKELGCFQQYACSSGTKLEKYQNRNMQYGNYV